ncbi:PREDICTED: uncharacterized protein KIAA1751-like, partial [Galeopterus variegatus]|uniref:Uncharacterized protein KIAA1751-like n=2 Tax=Galeopterus variegatus TaxID=482537 RepID=A0ABM0S2J5_GALVR
MEEAASLFPEQELLDTAALLEDERNKLEDPESEAEALSQAAPGCCRSVKEQATGAGHTKREAAAGDRARPSHLRESLGFLDKMREDKELFIQKMRGELRSCRQRMDLIRRQQEHVAAEIAVEREASNTAAVGRLQATSRRLIMELGNEKDLQSKVTAMLKESESAMWHIEIKERQFEALRKSVQEEREAMGRRLQVHAADLLRQEQEAVGKAERNRLLRIRRSSHIQREHGLRHQKLVEEAQRNHRVAVTFLRASLGRIRQQEKEAETASREHLQRRMDAVLALKGSITASRETLRKFQAWGQARAELAAHKAQAEKELILAQGGDAFRHLFHQQRRQELEAQRRYAHSTLVTCTFPEGARILEACNFLAHPGLRSRPWPVKAYDMPKCGFQTLDQGHHHGAL